MADSQNKADVTPGSATRFVPRPGSDSITVTEIIALALSAVWLVMVGAFFLFMPSGSDADGFDSLRFVITLLVIFMPVAMIWVAAISAKSARILRHEARGLQAAVDAMRQTYLAERQGQRSAAPAGPGTVERKLNDIVQANRPAESVSANFSSTRETASRPPMPRPAVNRPPAPGVVDDQPTLALGTPAEDIDPPLSRHDMIRALNFPDTDTDEVGFAALRSALRQRQARQLIQASQDVLTLLSQDGIYMDDLRPDRAKPEVWRRFANGERGRAVAALGGVRDRSCLALTMGRMREDTIFRDAAHHFLRLFDRMLVAFEPEATDEELSDLSETRTARAFMLLGRVTGAFD